MANDNETAINPRREEDFPEWYQQVIKEAELAENSAVRGCMVIKPWGYGLWESIQRELDRRIKATGHDNAYFPIFIPLSFFEKEATHVDGFAKECAVVTHHRLEQRDGKLVPVGKLDEPLIVRPTSETIIGDSFSRWVKSYRDLPLLINQWCNVVRWEMRTRMFLRTAEFLWQEGHTAHANKEEALEEMRRMLGVYHELMVNELAIPIIPGEKPPNERFAGADITLSIEAMMQDRKALQAGTSHYLGQNFAKASNIKFLNERGETEYAYTTSWGLSTRSIGGLIMTHADDNGLRVPPRVAPKHIVILPILGKSEHPQVIYDYAAELAHKLRAVTYHGNPLVVEIDKRDLRGGEKSWQWVKKGIPLRIEVGQRDMEAKSAVVYRRDKMPREKISMTASDIPERVASILDEMQSNYYSEALKFRDSNIIRDVRNFDEFKAVFTPKNKEKPEIHGGFVLAKWSGDPKTEEVLADLKVTVRCLPFEQSNTVGKCVITGKEARSDAIFAKAY